MRIEWFHNGRPLGSGSRIRMIDDFGFVVLDIDWTFPRDAGEYVCRATNRWGSATTRAKLVTKGNGFSCQPDAERKCKLESFIYS